MIRERGNLIQQPLTEMFNRSVVKFGDCTCQMWKTGPNTIASMTYAQVGRRVKELAAGLIKLGVLKGDRVAIMSNNSPRWLWADFSILNAGGVTVTVYPTLSAQEMAFVVKDSGSKMLYVQNSETLSKALQARELMPDLEKIIVMEDQFASDNPDVLDLNTVRDLGTRFLVKNPIEYERRWRSVDLFDNMTIIYTSGTTGKQKGAVHTHFSFNAGFLRDQRWSPSSYETDVYLSFLPLSHSYERGSCQTSALSVGAAIAYADRPSTVMQDLQIFNPTTLMSVPRIYERIYMAIRDAMSVTPEGAKAFEAALRIGVAVAETRMDENGCIDMSEDIDFSQGLDPELKEKYQWADTMVYSKVRALFGNRFRVSFSAAGALPADLCKAFMAMGIRIIEGYGMTETCNTLACNPVHKILPGSVGPLLPGVEGRIAEDGELLVRGDNIIREYWNNSEATEEVFTPDGFFKTGDVVQQLPNGYLKIVDRKKGIIVLDTGKNIPAAKIENSFSTSNWIDQVVAVGDDKKYVGALVVPTFDAFLAYFKNEGIAYDESKIEFFGEDAERICIQVGDDFITNEQLKAIVDREIKQVNEQLEEYETIKRYAILSRRFSEAADEVTPTLKLKRNFITKKYADIIKGLY